VPNSTSIVNSTGDSGFLISAVEMVNIDSIVYNKLKEDEENTCKTYWIKSNCPRLKWVDMFGYGKDSDRKLSIKSSNFSFNET
jgi:hypothetical protein